MIKLGGNIQLDGFNNIEPAKLIVVKKIVGNFVKALEQNNKIALTLKLDGEFNINAELSLNDEIKTSSINDKNLFFAVNKALKGLKTK